MRTKLAIKSENMTLWRNFSRHGCFRGHRPARTDQFGLGERGTAAPFTATATSSCPFLHISLRRRPHRGHHVLSGGTFSMRPNTKAASSDTIARAPKELCPGQCHLQERLGASYAFNTAEKLNRLLLSMLFRLGLLERAACWTWTSTTSSPRGET